MGASLENVAQAAARDGLTEAAVQLQAAADARKCWACGCLRHALDAIDRALPGASRPASLAETMVSARARLVPQRYECLGCDVCYPAVALNPLGTIGGCSLDEAVCPTETVEIRAGWPPLPDRIACCAIKHQSLSARLTAKI